MAIADKGALGTGTSSTNSTACTMTSATTTAAVGDIVLIGVCADNTSTADGDNSEVSSISESGGNTWTKLAEYTNSPTGAAADGVTVSLWMSRITTQISIGTVITANFSGNRVMKFMGGRVYTVAAGNTLTQSAAAVTSEVNGANDFGSSSFSGLSSKERLYFRLMGKEANTTTALTSTTNYTGGPGGRSLNDVNAVTMKSEFRIVTATGETSNPTLAVSGDTAGVFVALEELALSPTMTPAQAALTFTGQTPTVTIANAAAIAQPAAGALAFTGLAPAAVIGSNITIVVPAGSLRFKGPASPSPVFQPGTGALTLTGRAPTVFFALQTVPTAALHFTGLAPTVLVQTKGTFLIPTGTLTLTGQFVGQGFGSLPAGALTITGYAPSLRYGIGPSPNTAALSLNGPAPTVIVRHILAIPAGALTLDGPAPNAAVFGQWSPAPAALRFTGWVPQVTITADPSPTFTPGVARLVLTTYAPIAAPNGTVGPSQAQLQITGYAPTVVIIGTAVTIAVPAGALTFSGQAPVLNYFYVLTPGTARLRLLGPDPEMVGVQFGSGKAVYPIWQSVVLTF